MKDQSTYYVEIAHRDNRGQFEPKKFDNIPDLAIAIANEIFRRVEPSIFLTLCRFTENEIIILKDEKIASLEKELLELKSDVK